MTAMPEPDRPGDTLRESAAWARIDQATILATGKDAVRFVDNFLTASVSSLAAGSGTEAFVTDVRGHVIALVTILRSEDSLDAGSLEIVAPSGLGEPIRDHLEHFHIREAVELTDASYTVAAILVAGPHAAIVVASLMPAGETLPSSCLDHRVTSVAGHTVRVVRVTGQGADGYWVRGLRDALDAVSQALASAGVPEASVHDLEAARITAGYPAAVDIDTKALPQELGRDARAISFTKGCYLGQETVARLDALGHVNRRLAILEIEADKTRPSPLPCPSPVHHGESVVGTLTSSCVDARSGRTVGLAIIHTKALPATSLTIGPSTARILAVPPNRLEFP